MKTQALRSASRERHHQNRRKKEEEDPNRDKNQKNQTYLTEQFVVTHKELLQSVVLFVTMIEMFCSVSSKSLISTQSYRYAKPHANISSWNVNMSKFGAVFCSC